MRVLMFGWEFPPHIAGGLGTACYGMTKGLAENDVKVLFVMPSASGDEDQSAVSIINASDVAVDTVSESVDEFLGSLIGIFSRCFFGVLPFNPPIRKQQRSECMNAFPTKNPFPVQNITAKTIPGFVLG